MTSTQWDDAPASMVVVANRLPFDIEQHPDGTTSTHQAPGGLVTALEPILSRREGAWIGWTGSADLDLPPTKAGSLTLVPIRLTADEVETYYEGFSNATLWPLYHDAVAESKFDRDWWESYVSVNRKFAQAAADRAAPGATVWVHDYQLHLVPEMLRALRPDLRIGFFLHIPFPPSELFNRLPWRTQLLRGLLGADLIGFQLPGGARNFVRCARALLDIHGKGRELRVDGRTVIVDAFPISIDAARLVNLASEPQIQRRARELRAELGNPRRIILGVDRLDYTKGIDVRLHAFEELLRDKDPSVNGAVMVQLATPSRERLLSYARMRESIERQVGAINGNYGRIGAPAVHYLHQSVPREDLAAFYAAADVMTVTPLRDGMNLVAKEYVVCRVNGGGVLLLSEFTGAARELKTALMVNPYDTDGMKEALRTALTMPAAEARRRMRALRRQVLTNDVDRWATRYLSTLEGTADRLTVARRRIEAPLRRRLTEVAGLQRLLIALDFDGTLAPIVDDPATARPLDVSMEALRELASIPGTEVAVISGRARALLPELLGVGVTELHLVGSHGAEGIPDDPAGEGTLQLTPAARQRLGELRRSLQQIAAEHAGVTLEIKPTGIAVHVRGATESTAALVKREIEEGPASWPGVHLLRGKQVMELTVISTDKGRAVEALRKRLHADAVLFVGDDITDENAFASLRAGDLGVKVGPGPSAASERVSDPEAVADILVFLSAERRSLSRELAASLAKTDAGGGGLGAVPPAGVR